MRKNQDSNKMIVKQEQPKRLYRSEKNKIIAGVCGGIGEYFNVDPVLIRLLFVILVFINLSGIFLYIVAWMIIPKRK